MGWGPRYYVFSLSVHVLHLSSRLITPLIHSPTQALYGNVGAHHQFRTINMDYELHGHKIVPDLQPHIMRCVLYEHVCIIYVAGVEPLEETMKVSCHKSPPLA